VAGNGATGSSGNGVQATNASFNSPSDVTMDALGNLYISGDDDQMIRKVATNGIITTFAGGGISGDGGPATNAELNLPTCAVLDAIGNLYINDLGDNRIRKVGTNGTIATFAGGGAVRGPFSGDGGPATNAVFDNPCGVALDASGNLYISDNINNRVRRVDKNGIITTVAGAGPSFIGSFSGDGGPATNAQLFSPQRVAFDALGNLYIADDLNSRIREVHLAQGPTLALNEVGTNNAGNYTVIITSPYGSVTSAVANLNVTVPSTPPQILAGGASFGFLTNHFGFDLSGAFGQTILVDASTDLVNWIPLFTNIATGTNPFYFSDPAWTNFPWRFYRSRLPQAILGWQSRSHFPDALRPKSRGRGVRVLHQMLRLKPMAEQARGRWRGARIAFISPRVNFLADFCHQRRQQFFVSCGPQGFVRGKPALLWNQRRVRRFRKLRMQCHLSLALRVTGQTTVGNREVLPIVMRP
jgi:hypothetical protein